MRFNLLFWKDLKKSKAGFRKLIAVYVRFVYIVARTVILVVSINYI